MPTVESMAAVLALNEARLILRIREVIAHGAARGDQATAAAI
jgi:hypothetical protein